MRPFYFRWLLASSNLVIYPILFSLQSSSINSKSKMELVSPPVARVATAGLFPRTFNGPDEPCWPSKPLVGYHRSTGRTRNLKSASVLGSIGQHLR